jgi:molybdopterin molybdotransferase
VISYDEALSRVLAAATPMPAEERELSQALGRVLAKDLVAPFDLPRFDNSAVDGYAVAGEPDRPFQVVRTIAAGDPPGAALADGTCARIFTGAPTPAKTYAVAMQEDVTSVPDGIVVAGPLKRGQNVRRAGEEFGAGELAFGAGLSLNAAGLAGLAAIGRATVEVHRAPKIGLVVTGSELVPLGTSLADGQIYETNGICLAGALAGLGLSPEFQVVVNDEPDSTAAAIAEALGRCDVLIVTGGVSVGDRDVVKSVLESMGVDQVFWRIALKPGKPVYFGTRTRDGAMRQAIFGLPGNPMSVLVTFLLLVRPYLKAVMGDRNPGPLKVQASMREEYRHKTGRREFVPAQFDLQQECLGVRPLLHQGSHMMGGMAAADGLIDVPADVEMVKTGETVWVLPFGKVML